MYTFTVDLDLVVAMILGPGMFVMGAFFVMLPFTPVRLFGAAMLGYSVLGGKMDYGGALDWNAYVICTLLTMVASAAGVHISYRVRKGAIKEVLSEFNSGHPGKEASGSEPRAGGSSGSKDAQQARRFVPYSRDGSWFHPGLMGIDGKYRVGQRGNEKVAPDYKTALAMLREMPIAAWRRPSPLTGIMGPVTAVCWAPPPTENVPRVDPSTLPVQAA